MRLILTFFCMVALINCSSNEKISKQKQDLLSPSSKYTVQVPIEKCTSNSRYRGTPVWKVTIFDKQKNVMYKDDSSIFIGTLNVYWGWDDSDRLWLYNSDDGMIWRWEHINGKWNKLEGEGAFSIPEKILPAYAKK